MVGDVRREDGVFVDFLAVDENVAIPAAGDEKLRFRGRRLEFKRLAEPRRVEEARRGIATGRLGDVGFTLGKIARSDPFRGPFPLIEEPGRPSRDVRRGGKRAVLVFNLDGPEIRRVGDELRARVDDLRGRVRVDPAGVPDLALQLLGVRLRRVDADAVRRLALTDRGRVRGFKNPTQTRRGRVESLRIRKIFAAQIRRFEGRIGARRRRADRQRGDGDDQRRKRACQFHFFTLIHNKRRFRLATSRRAAVNFPPIILARPSKRNSFRRVF